MRCRIAVVMTVLVLALVGCGGSSPRPAPVAKPPDPLVKPASAVDSTQPSTRPAAIQEIELRVSVWDDTSQEDPSVEVWVKGHGSWYPDLTWGADVKTLGSFPIDEPHDMFIYPDGRNGKEIKVSFTMRSDMVSGSDRDTLRVEIHDGKVVVRGPAIDGMSSEFRR